MLLVYSDLKQKFSFCKSKFSSIFRKPGFTTFKMLKDKRNDINVNIVSKILKKPFKY